MGGNWELATRNGQLGTRFWMLDKPLPPPVISISIPILIPIAIAFESVFYFYVPIQSCSMETSRCCMGGARDHSRARGMTGFIALRTRSVRPANPRPSRPGSRSLPFAYKIGVRMLQAFSFMRWARGRLRQRLRSSWWLMAISSSMTCLSRLMNPLSYTSKLVS